MKVACQSNDFLSSKFLVKARILFLLIFSFYSFAAKFLLLKLFSLLTLFLLYFS